MGLLIEKAESERAPHHHPATVYGLSNDKRKASRSLFPASYHGRQANCINCTRPAVFTQMPRMLKRTANIPQATTIITIALTTAAVAASPTAEELLPHWKPW